MTLKTPTHYAQSEKQPIELMKEFMSADAYEGFLVGNVVKYIMRYKYKDGLADLLKCKDYLEILISEFDEDSVVKEEISNAYNVSNDSRATTANSKDNEKPNVKITTKSSKKEELDF